MQGQKIHKNFSQKSFEDFDLSQKSSNVLLFHQYSERPFDLLMDIHELCINDGTAR